MITSREEDKIIKKMRGM